MDAIIEPLFISIIAGFFCRTIAIMATYTLTYGQVFGFVKMWIAGKIDSDSVQSVFNETMSQSQAEEQSRVMYDALCDYKSWSIYTVSQRRWSFLLSLLDCSFCIGFWVSVFCAVVMCFFTHWAILLFLPVMTFFYIEKV